MVTFEYPIDIIKLGTSGQVAVYNSATNIFVTSYSPDNVKITTTDDETVKITFDNNDALYLNINLVDNTQIQPALPIAFAGTVFDLAELLATDFFFEVSGGGDAIDVTYDNAVSGLAATNVQDAIDEVVAAGGYPISYPVGYYTNFNHVAANGGSNFVAANYYYGAIQEILTPVTISAPRIRIPAGAVGNGIVALYKYNGTQWILIDQTAAYNTNITGVATLAWSTGDLNLVAGVYCWCTNTSAGNSFETIIMPALNNYFGSPATMNAQPLSLQLHSSAYTGTALATMPMALSSAGFAPNILNKIM